MIHLQKTIHELEADLDAILQLVLDDKYASGYQTMGQYRTDLACFIKFLATVKDKKPHQPQQQNHHQKESQ